MYLVSMSVVLSKVI